MSVEQLTNEKWINLVKKDGWVWATRNKPFHLYIKEA